MSNTPINPAFLNLRQHLAASAFHCPSHRVRPSGLRSVALHKRQGRHVHSTCWSTVGSDEKLIQKPQQLWAVLASFMLFNYIILKERPICIIHRSQLSADGTSDRGQSVGRSNGAGTDDDKPKSPRMGTWPCTSLLIPLGLSLPNCSMLSGRFT